MAKARWPAVVAIAIVLIALATGSWVSGCRKAETPNETYERIVRTTDHGDLNTSLVAVEEALSKNVGNSVEWHWRFLVLKARILISRSLFQDALNLLHEELPTSLASSDVAVRKKLLEGIAHRNGQEFEKSQQHLDEALALARSAQPQLECEVVKAIGELQVDENKYAEADTSFRQALDLARKENRQDQVATVLVDLARLSTSEERFGEAIDRNQSALDLSRSLDMQGLVATILGNAAWSYSALGDFERARSSFKEAADAAEGIGQKGYSLYWLTGVANSDIALHNLESAESLLKGTLTRAREINDPATITTCLNALAEISLKANRLDEAANFDEEALRIEDAGLDHFGTLQSLLLAGRIETSRRHFARAEKLLRAVLRDPKADRPSRWEAAARLAKLHDDEGLPKRAEQEYRQSIETIEAARAAITQPELQLSFLSGAIEFYDGYVDFLVAHGRPVDALRVAELSRARTLEEGLGVSTREEQAVLRNFHPEQIAQRLRATLLVYRLGEKQSHLWVITPARTNHVLLPPASQIEVLVKSYQEAVTSTRDPLQSASSDAQKLYSLALEPAMNLIPAHSRIVILPDGSLYGLNFETLIVPSPNPRYWIEDVTLSTGSSLTLLASGARPAPTGKSLFLVGDTIAPNDNFPKLMQAADEMKAVQKYFPKSQTQILTQGDATPSAYLLAQPEKYAYLHFVTHGTASRARPLESAVILSKEKSGDAYKLYARDIVKQRLAANIVTISACNTSGTRTFSGEGLVGLSWAFLRAGAHNVIGALWEVSDTATPQLMDKFYEALSRGEDPASALRHAKLSLLHSDGVFRKPRYWAPFQLYTGS